MNRTLLNWAGPYDAEAMYCKGDVATSAGAGFVSISFPNTGNPLTDTAHWTPLGSLTDSSAWATLAHAAIVTINGGGGSGSKATPMLTWATPSALTYGAALTSAQLNATSNALGSFAYTPALGSVLPAGSHTLSVTFTPLDTSVYVPVTATVTLTVAKATPVITWLTPPSLLYTDSLSSRQLNASTPIPGSFTYSPSSGTTLALGTATLSATFTPTDLANYATVTTTRSLTVTVTAPPPALVQSAAATAPTHSAPLTFALASAPAVGNTVAIILPYNPVGTGADYDYTPPDATWTVFLGGRAGPSAGSGNRFLVATHVVVPGDGASFTFYPTPGGGTGVAGVILELSGTSAAAQVAFVLYPGTSNGQATPALTPAAPSSLAIACDCSAYTYPLASGWTALSAATTFGLAVQTAVSADASTPISTTFGGYSPGYAMAGLILFAPGPLCSTPVASPAAVSTTAATQTVTLACATSGATIHYTLDGTVPTTSSPVYSAPFTFDRTTTLGVLATAPGYAPSGPALYTFIVAAGTLLGVGLDGNLHGYLPFPNDAWHTPIDTAAVDPNSSAKLTLMGSTGQSNISPDLAIQYNVVDPTPGLPYTTRLSAFSANISPSDASLLGESDVTMVPLPANPAIEGNPGPGQLIGSNDQHVLLFDRTGALYEFWRFVNGTPGGSRPAQFSCNSAAIFDLTLPDCVQRPYTRTSADAGGLSVFEGLARFDEVLAAIADGSMCLKHALRMDSATFGAASVGSSGYGYFELPATHSAATGRQDIADANLIYYGMRIRLQAGFDVSGYSLVNQVILNTGKKFGWILADIEDHHSFSFNLAADPRWDATDITALYAVTSAHLEVVAPSTPIHNGASYPAGPAPTIASFTASATTVAHGTPVTLTATWDQYGTFGVVDKVGLIRNGVPVTFTPAATGTYLLTLTVNGLNLANDSYGTGGGTRPTATLTLTVT